jgi:hypothetical protein
MTKSQQIAAFLLRPEGTTYSEVVAMTGWASVSIPRQAELNRLRLRTVERPGEPKRFFGYKPTIKIRERADVPAPSSPLPPATRKIIPQKETSKYRAWRVADVCAVANMEVVRGRGRRFLRCKQCALNYLISDRNLVRAELVEHVKRHAQTHVRQRERAERSNANE